MQCINPSTRIELADGRIRIQPLALWRTRADLITPDERTLLIPCSKCPSCKFNKAKQITQRLILESQFWQHRYFITLTYDNEHLKYPKERLHYNDHFGSLHWRPTLSIRDYQLFIKRLRKHMNAPICYIIAGEYGGKTHRPHYHLIVFTNKELPDLRLFHSDKENPGFISPLFERIWPFGHHMINRAQFGAFGYVGQYVVKKLGTSSKRDKLLLAKGYQPTFIRYSKARGGIGFRAFNFERDISRGYIAVQNPEKETIDRIPIPRSFINKEMRETKAGTAKSGILLDFKAERITRMAKSIRSNAIFINDDAFRAFVTKQKRINHSILQQIHQAHGKL